MTDNPAGISRITSAGGSGARRRHRGAFLAAVVALGLGVAALPSASIASEETATYVVTSLRRGEAKAKVEHQRGRVDRNLPVVKGVAARLTAKQRTVLDRQPGVVVTPNFPVTLLQTLDTTTTTSRAPAAVFPQLTGADRLAATGVDGAGVTVAVLDTGIANLPDFAGRLLPGIDLSGEGDATRDSYGHGTFVAGLVAGNGASSGGAYGGEAPGARLVPVKVAGATGATDLVTVLAGIDWVVTNKPLLGIGVLNVSFGAMPNGSTLTNPLNQAVEAAWRAGIVVVASAGNAGPFNGTVTTPGDSPLVVTAGALDDMGTADAADDTMPAFSSVGPTSADGWYKPDLVTSGRSVVSLRVPGSTIDTNHPSARVGLNNFVGSGTSFSAAVTSGAAALVLQARPNATPDEVKGRLVGTAAPGPLGNPFVDGGGSLDAYRAATAPDLAFIQPTVTASVTTEDDGDVSLYATWQLSPWNGSSWNGSSWNGSSWNGSSWNGSSWNGLEWDGSSWNGSAWNGSAWNGGFWNGSSWNGSSWNGSSWNGSSWNGSAWNGSSWNGSSWNGSSWNGSSWNGSSWNGSSWN